MPDARVQCLEQTDAFLAIWSRRSGEPLGDWIDQTAYGWLADLPVDELASFAEELASSQARGDVPELLAMIRITRDLAAMYRHQSDVLRQMLEAVGRAAKSGRQAATQASSEAAKHVARA